MSKLAIVYWSGTGNTESMAAMVWANWLAEVMAASGPRMGRVRRNRAVRTRPPAVPAYSRSRRISPAAAHSSTQI